MRSLFLVFLGALFLQNVYGAPTKISSLDTLNADARDDLKCSPACFAKPGTERTDARPFKCDHNDFHRICLKFSLGNSQNCPTCSAEFDDDSQFAKEKLLAATDAIKRKDTDALREILEEYPLNFERLKVLVEIGVKHDSKQVLVRLANTFTEIMSETPQDSKAVRWIARTLTPIVITVQNPHQGTVSRLYASAHYNQAELIGLLNVSARKKSASAIGTTIKYMREHPIFDLQVVWDTLYELHNIVTSPEIGDYDIFSLWVSIIKTKDVRSLPVLKTVSWRLAVNDPYYQGIEMSQKFFRKFSDRTLSS